MKTISDHILDIVQNSITAKATLIEIIVEESKKNDLCLLKIIDDGCGMTDEMVKQASNPFFTSRKTRKVGLGLSLLKQNAEGTGGKFNIFSELKKGTIVNTSFQLSHWDKPELGDVWNTFYLTLLGNEKVNFSYQHITEKGEFKIESNELKEMLKGVSLQKAEIRDGICDLIKNNIRDIQ